MSTGLYSAFIVITLTVVGWCTAQEEGTVTTDKMLYYVGENLEVHCYLNRPVASDAYFEYNSTTMSRHYVTVVNETYLRLDKQVADTDIPETQCACFVGEDMVGDPLDILSEYRPRGVTNLHYEYCNENDVCASWSLGVKYRLGIESERREGSNTVIAAEYTNDSEHGPWMKCDLWQNFTGCVARNLNGWTLLSLRVTITNVRRNDTEFELFDRLALVSDEKMTRVTAGKPLYYVGENMTVHCFLERTGASDASFSYGSDTVSRGYVTVVNDTYLRLDRQVTAMDPFEASCYCVDGNNNTVGSAYILTEYRPQNVTDLKFEYYDKDIFHASWSIGVNYKSGTPTLNTSITVIKAEYTKNITHGPWNDCKLFKDSSGCTTGGKGGWPRLSLRVTIANIKRNDSAIALFYNLALDNYVKPAPVNIRRTEILNSTCAKVVWWSDRFYPLYRISWDVTTLNTSEEQITICSLHPFHNYTVSVQALPRSGFPGVLQTVTLHMPEDAPSTGPKLTEGGYYRKQCSAGQNSSSHIYIYFKPVPPEDRNSATLNYTAKLYMDGQETQELHLKDPESNLLTVSVPCGQGFFVTMYAANRVGVSPQTSLTVPADDKVSGLLKEIEDLDLHVEEFREQDMKKTARWTWRSHDTVLKQLRFYYCDAKTCTAEACTQWTLLENIDVNIENQNYTFNAGKADKFGFAAATFHGSWTGIVFTKCTYSTDYSQGSSVNLNLKAPTLTSEEGHIRVSWHHSRCDSGSRLLIHRWIVKWCLLETCREDEVYTRSSSVEHILRDVHINVKYNISIAAVTSHGNSSYSDSSFVEVKPSGETGLKVEYIAGISVAILMVILAMVLWFCRIKWKEAKMKFSKTIVFPIPNRTWKNASDIIHQPRNSAIQKGYEHETNCEDKIHRENKKQKQDDCESGYGGSEKPPYKHCLDVPKMQKQRSLYVISVLEDQQGGESSSEDNQGCKTHNVMDLTNLSTNKTSLLFPPVCSHELLNILEQNKKLGVEEKQGMAAGKEISETSKFTCNSLELLCNTASAPMHPEYILCRPKLDSLEPLVESTIELLGICRSGEAQQNLSSSVEISAACDPPKNNKTSYESCTEDKVSTLMNGVCQPTMSSCKQASGSDINEIIVCNRSQKTPSETESHKNLLPYVPMNNLSEMIASPKVVPLCGDKDNEEEKDVLIPCVTRMEIDRNMLIPAVMKMGDGKSQAEKTNAKCLILSENEGGSAVMDLYVTMARIEHMKNHTEGINLHDRPYATKNIDNGGVEFKKEKEEGELFRAEKLNVDEVQSSAAVTDIFKDGCNYWNSLEESGTKNNELFSTNADEDITIKAFPEESSKAEEKSLKKDFKCAAHSSFHTQGYISIDTVVHPRNMGNLQICG
ncbi:uncharacterized protein LOC112573106 isoform X3 [Pomacea canaliculata]|uniref:uncharacterized protein LOC112573106 isoform X3 n=1 Tax=Pomacea canaliculata TaxID=400727 RepID=UPI000D73E29B|nr:uncharacterized protein LOC112573106 isoform X3 [Pomacea canaliculata]XP_025108922.1 uncharacterized protein LOC112573106 isoform X3 [Pomacea canaliculata]XP_025108923.1 uncharacterized protein LOC112573106 isoform X3 [Pomacea canaliculata]